MIQFLDIKKFKKGLQPVTSTEMFLKPGEFHPDGLFSEIIFGPDESSDRKKTFSYINLNALVVHPSAYILLIQLNRKIEKFLSTEGSFILDKKGMLQEDAGGVTGIAEFIKLLPKIKFNGGTDTRDAFIKKIKDSYQEGTLFLNMIPVIPPEQRNVYQDEKGMWIEDPLNDYYRALIRRAFQIRSTSSGPLYDLLNYELQKAVIAHDNFIRKLIQKKSGLIRSQMLAKRTDFSGRAVITPDPNLKVNELGVPLRMAIGIFEPFIIHRLFNSGKVDQHKLAKGVQEYTGFELSIDSIKSVFKSIKNGDKIPKDLYGIIWDATEVSMMGRYVITKRDPVLHAKSVRGMKPILVDGNTMQLCTLQVAGFNADFDGDSCLVDIIYYKSDQNKKCHISELDKNEKFIQTEKNEKTNGTIVKKYKPVNNLSITAIDPKTGNVNQKKILEYSKHENIEMYKIHDKKNRFENFWTSYDHSLIIYDEYKMEIRKISPKELLENPDGKFLIQDQKISNRYGIRGL